MKKYFKKLLALALSTALLLSCLIIPGVAVAADEVVLDVWDGTSDAVPVDSDNDGIFEISTPEQLANYVKNDGQVGGATKTAILTNDIWLNDMTVSIVDGAPVAVKASDPTVTIDLTAPETNGLNTWFNDGFKDGWFVGTLDGNGHVVNGLYINQPAELTANGNYGLGLIPRSGDCTVKNLGIENSYMLSNTSYVAAFILGNAHTKKATISNCYVGASAYHEGLGKYSPAIAGGGGSGVTATDCYSLATLVSSGMDTYGAIVGDSWGKSTMIRCYTANGYNVNRSNDTATDCYSISEAPGAAAATSMANLGGAYATTDGYPVLKVFTENPKAWGGFMSAPADADGDGVYEISTAEEFAYATKPGTENVNYILTDDIVINDITVKIEDGVGVVYDANDAKVEDPSTLRQWHTGQTAVSTVTYDGNGHTVRGIVSTNTYGTSESANNQASAIVNKAWAVTFKNIGIEDMYINVTNASAGGFMGNIWSQQNDKVENSYLGESVYLCGAYAGGVLACGGGNSTYSVKNTYVLATVKSNASSSKIGAITGDVWSCTGSIAENVYATTKLFGNNAFTQKNCYGAVSAANIVGAKASTAMPNLGEAFVITDGVPTLKTFVNDDSNVWGGFAKAPVSGTGTSEDPFMITTAAELAYAIRNTANIYVADAAGTYKYDEETSAYVALAEGEVYEGTLYAYITPSYKLANDIYLNDVSKINWATGAVADGYVARSWYTNIAVQGSFDGDGHTVYGMYISTAKGDLSDTNWEFGGGAGLFPEIAKETTLSITGMGVDKAFVNAKYGASAFVGSKDSNNGDLAVLNVSESYVGEDVTLIGYDTGAAIGINRGITTTVTDFYTLASQKAESRTGIISDIYGGSGKIIRSYNGKGALDSKNNSSCTNSYATATGGSGAIVLSADSMQGKKALVTMYGLGDKFVTTEGYPVLALFNQPLDEDLNVELGTPPFSGAGTEADPYLISTAEDLRNMVGLGGEGAYYKLTNDIYVNDVNAVDWLTGTVNEGYTPEEWFFSNNENGNGYNSYLSKTQKFSGTVNGNGYAIHGLYYEYGNTYTAVGLIPYADSVTVTDLGIEDSFIGGGRFTGGIVGYTAKGVTVNLSGCYVDDSCAVLGWDAGASYVDSDSDIHTSGGSGLCSGKATYTYKEDAAGTYILDGETYRAFTATDYEGTKYAYDEATATYVESAEGTYLLDGETYRAITIDDYTGTRYSVDDIIWSNVGFTSEALGGLVGRYESTATGTIENCYVTAKVASTEIKSFGFNSQGVTFAEEGANGGGIGHVGGLWGDDYGATVSATNCFSVVRPHEDNVGSNLYTLATGLSDGRVSVSVATGAEGLSEMTGLDTAIWYAVKADGAYPQLRLRGTVIADVDENGVGGEATDIAALRVVLIDDVTPNNADVNRNNTVNICDLVALASK